MNQTEAPQPIAPAAHHPPAILDRETVRRLKRGHSDYGSKDCGPPTRSPSGEWMERIAFDLPEAMHEALVGRAGGDDGARIGEVIRAALAAVGIGDPSHVPGICDGSYSDDAERAAAEAERAEWHARLRDNLIADRAAVKRRRRPAEPAIEQ